MTIVKKISLNIGESLEFCCEKLDNLYALRLLKHDETEGWYIDVQDQEYDWIRLEYCPFCGKGIYER
jgi:hypothetical protein